MSEQSDSFVRIQAIQRQSHAICIQIHIFLLGFNSEI